MKNSIKFLIKYWLIITLIVTVITVIIFVLALKSPKQLEKEMKKLVIEYYETKIKGNVIGVDKQIVTLETLSDYNYDISNFKNCNQESYSYIIIENPLETDKNKIKYTVENHLNCD